MPRFEFTEGTSTKFWEITLHGAAFTTRWGRLGTDGQSKTQNFVSAAVAEREYQKLIVSKTKKGYQPSGDAGPAAVATADLRAPSAENPELEAACLAAPESGEPWAVYADWLQAQGDVRGELAALFMAGKQPEAEVLLKRHAQVLWGEVAGAVENEEVKDLEVQHGFYRRASLHIGYDAERSLDGLTQAFLARPVTRFVTALRFGLAHYESNNDWGPTMEAITSSPRAAALRELRFDDYTYEDCELSWAPMGNLARYWKALPSLEVLHLRSGAGGVLGELELPRLKTFIRESGGLSASELASIVGARWPELERLEVWTGSSNYGAEATVDMLLPVLEGASLPKLTRLGLVNSELAPALIPILASSRLLPRLRVLDLSRGVLTDSDVDALVGHAAAFQHLERLDLSENLLAARVAEVQRVFPRAHLGEQREGDDEERYVAVGE
jgi:uncharacterized protein (TIGR02996 family)